MRRRLRRVADWWLEPRHDPIARARAERAALASINHAVGGCVFQFTGGELTATSRAYEQMRHERAAREQREDPTL